MITKDPELINEDDLVDKVMLNEALTEEQAIEKVKYHKNFEFPIKIGKNSYIVESYND